MSKSVAVGPGWSGLGQILVEVAYIPFSSIILYKNTNGYFVRYARLS